MPGFIVSRALRIVPTAPYGGAIGVTTTSGPGLALKSETIYAGPQLTTMTFWHPNGRVALRGPALDGSRQGLWRVWTQAGLLAEEGTYVGSVRQGTWKVYSEDGTRVTEIVYAKNVRVSRACR